MHLAIRRRELTPLLRRILWADAAVELALAIVLTGVVGRVHWWLNVERPVTVIAAAVFGAAAALVALMAWSRRTSPELVQYVAFANVVGGLAVWLGTVLNWDRFEPEGLWLIAAAANAFIILGALELIALRRR